MVFGKLKATALMVALGLATLGAAAKAFQSLPTANVTAATANPAPPADKAVEPQSTLSDGPYKEIQRLASDVRLHLVHGRKAEALSTLRRLSETAQAWDTAIRADGGAGDKDGGPRAARQPIMDVQSCTACHAVPDAHGRVDPTTPTRGVALQLGGPPPVLERDQDQDRRIRRLEELLEELLKKRGREAGESDPFAPAKRP
jgi:hypothetical protein